MMKHLKLSSARVSCSFTRVTKSWASQGFHALGGLGKPHGFYPNLSDYDASSCGKRNRCGPTPAHSSVFLHVAYKQHAASVLHTGWRAPPQLAVNVAASYGGWISAPNFSSLWCSAPVKSSVKRPAPIFFSERRSAPSFFRVQLPQRQRATELDIEMYDSNLDVEMDDAFAFERETPCKDFFGFTNQMGSASCWTSPAEKAPPLDQARKRRACRRRDADDQHNAERRGGMRDN
ncbi:hypothetical protein BESB_035760 [Besnoitia besnoiti]|uniref:Uncharacterized protein n=1 Tax=Besnoitia besnoiti TaxID=94643 RepID=A0A2A9MF22_BESBE|nr:hypothetical protein BESB_035760 [Besnoitia besnoiti]PFH37118.1 hypothetical protein BESB_035760 [Besnoitia besnoiti]